MSTPMTPMNQDTAHIVTITEGEEKVRISRGVAGAQQAPMVTQVLAPPQAGPAPAPAVAGAPAAPEPR